MVEQTSVVCCRPAPELNSPLMALDISLVPWRQEGRPQDQDHVLELGLCSLQYLVYDKVLNQTLPTEEICLILSHVN